MSESDRSSSPSHTDGSRASKSSDDPPGSPSSNRAAVAEAPELRLRPWASLAFRNFSLLWASVAFTSMGMTMRQMANLWQVYDLSGSAMQLGITGLFQAIPFFSLGLIGGAVADAIDRKLLILIIYTLNLVLALLLGVLTATGLIEVWHIYAATAASSSLNIFNNPARMALIPHLVPRTHLMNAITLQTTLFQGSMLLGPMIGGLLMGRTGTASVYFVNAALFVPAIFAVAALAAPKIPAEHRPALRPTAIVEGLRFFLSARAIMALVLLDVGATVFGNYQVLLPIFAKDILAVGPTGFGALNAAPAMGALLGAGTLLLLKVRRPGILVIASVFLFALALAGFGWSTWFALSLCLAGALGYLDALGVVIRQTMVQTLTPDHLRGRTTAVSTMFSAGAPSLGGVISGFAAGLLGAAPAVLIGSVLVGAATAGIAAAFGSLRRLRAP